MPVKKGDKVKVDYEGKLDNGEVFDSSSHGDHNHPLEFEVGSGQVIKGFDEAVLGMEKDEEKEIHIKSEEAYGPHRPELQQKIPLDKLPKEPKPEPGMMLSVASPDGKQFPAKIIAVTAEEVTIDLNHPLAGQDLNFKIKLVEITN